MELQDTLAPADQEGDINQYNARHQSNKRSEDSQLQSWLAKLVTTFCTILRFSFFNESAKYWARRLSKIILETIDQA